MAEAYPLAFQTEYRQRLWGGDGEPFRSKFGRTVPYASQIAEAWELFDRPEGSSVVRNGPWAGLTLRRILEFYSEQIMGSGYNPQQPFPLLVKFIQTGEDCSIQVHPNHQQAAVLGCRDQGKNELWYILDAKPSASLLAGFQKPQTQASIQEAIAHKKLPSLLHCMQVRAGEAYFLPAGKVHAIGAGIFLAEIQDNSDLTFRVYDFDRCDRQGRKRPLHIEQALASIQFSDTHNGKVAVPPSQPLERTMERIPTPGVGWQVDRIMVADHWDIKPLATAQVFIITQGRGWLNNPLGNEPLQPGSVWLIPCQAKLSRIQTLESRLELLRCVLPYKHKG